MSLYNLSRKVKLDDVKAGEKFYFWEAKNEDRKAYLRRTGIGMTLYLGVEVDGEELKELFYATQSRPFLSEYEIVAPHIYEQWVQEVKDG